MSTLFLPDRIIQRGGGKIHNLIQLLESMQKDVECTFGILKGRWRILKSGIRLHGVDVADNIWKTYYALHNMMLHVDGYTEEWDDVLGQFDVEDMQNMPFAIQRLFWYY